VRIDFHYIHLEPTEALEAHARKSFASLEHIIRGIDPEGSALLKLEFIRSTHHHNKGLVYQAKAQFDLPKKVFHAEASGADMHATLDEARHKLVSAVERYKEQVRGRHAA